MNAVPTAVIEFIGALFAIQLGVGCTSPSAETLSTGVVQSALGAVGAPRISDEFELDHPSLIELATSCPQVAFGTTNYLVTSTPAQGDLAATPFSRSGRPLSTLGTPIAPSADFCAPVTFTGTTFVTLWSSGGMIRCARIAEDGTVLDPGGVSTGLPGFSADSATFDGTNVLFSISDGFVSQSNGRVALVGTDCSAASSPVSLQVTSGARYGSQGATFDGTQYWIAYSETLTGRADRLLLQAVTTSGLVNGSPVIVASAPWLRTKAGYPPAAVQGTIATGGGKTALAYSVMLDDSASGNALELWYAELSSGGVPGNQALLSSPLPFGTPKIGFAPNGFLLVSQNGARATVLLRPQSSSTVFSTLDDLTGTGSASFASDGTNVLLARAGAMPRQASSGIVETSQARLVGGDLQPLAPGVALRHTAARHHNVVVANGTQVSLAVWREADIGQPPFFRASRFSAPNAVLDELPLTVHPLTVESTTAPIVTSNGADFLVGWGETKPGTGYTRRANAAIVKGTGEVGPSFVASQGSDPSTYPVGYAPAVASNGRDYLMVWAHGDSVEATRITAEGTVVDDPPLVLQHLLALSGEVAVAYDGAEYVVVSHSVPPDATSAPLVLQRVTNDGAIGTPVATPWNQDAVFGDGNAPVIVWGADQGLVAFTQRENVFCGLISGSLEPLDPSAIVVTDHRAYIGDLRIAAAWDGTTYWVGWKDGRRFTGGSDDIYVARVATDGSLLDPSGILLSHGEWDGAPISDGLGLAGVALASGTGRAVAAYTRINRARGQVNFMLHGRSLSSDGTGGVSAGTGGVSAGTGGASVGTGGVSAGTGGVSAGTGGASAGTGGVSAGTGGASDGTGGVSAGTGGVSAGTGAGTAGASAGTAGASIGAAGDRADAGNAGSYAAAGEGDLGGEAGRLEASSGSAGVPSDGNGSPSGCGCRVGPSAGTMGSSAFWLAALVLPLSRRVRRRRY
jgi:MYXO-CTERM domain-containing protein